MDTKKKWIVGGVTVAVAGLFIWWVSGGNTVDTVRTDTNSDVITELNLSSTSNPSESLDVKNADYTIESRKVSIRDGVATESTTGSASTIKTSVLEGPAFADIDGDGKKDAVAILRDEPGGTGIFYYASVILGNARPLGSTNSVLLGDRIRIKEITVVDGKVRIVILDRKEGEAMVIPPSFEKTIDLKVVEGSLVKIAE